MSHHLVQTNAETLAFRKLRGLVFIAGLVLLAHPDAFSNAAQAEDAVGGGPSSLTDEYTTDDRIPAPTVVTVGPADQSRLDAEEAAVAAGTKPIYNTDDRIDWGLIRNKSVQNRAKSSVALFTKDSFALSTGDNNKLGLKALTLGEHLKKQFGSPICAGERFANQLSGALCSGTLIAEDLILTAGHCIREVALVRGVPVKDALFVFGYTAEKATDSGRSEFDRSDVFLGMKKIAGVLDNKSGEDWAIVQLARSVPKSVAKPVQKIRKSEKIKNDAKVYVIGYPTGLPLKYAPNAKLLGNSSEKFFTTDLDTFAGNSGSGVYLHETNDLVGILVRGVTDYYPDPDQNCTRAYRCPPYGCEGEDVTRTEIVKWPNPKR